MTKPVSHKKNNFSRTNAQKSWSDAFNAFPLLAKNQLPWLNALSQRTANINLAIENRTYQFRLLPFSADHNGASDRVSFVARISAAQNKFRVALHDHCCLSFLGISELGRRPSDIVSAIIEFHLDPLLSSIEHRAGCRIKIEDIQIEPKKLPACDCEVLFSLVDLQTGLRGIGSFLLDLASLQWLSGVFSDNLPIISIREYQDLPVRAGVIGARCKLTLDEINSLGIGDVLLLETTSDRAKNNLVTLKVQGQPMWECIKQDGNLVVVSYVEDKMAEDKKDGNAARQENTDLDSLEMDIEFELESIKMSLRELKSVQEGYVFDLEKKFEKYILVYANGRPIARGQIVRLGKRLGVRVLELLISRG